MKAWMAILNLSTRGSLCLPKTRKARLLSERQSNCGFSAEPMHRKTASRPASINDHLRPHKCSRNFEHVAYSRYSNIEQVYGDMQQCPNWDSCRPRLALPNLRGPWGISLLGRHHAFSGLLGVPLPAGEGAMLLKLFALIAAFYASCIRNGHKRERNPSIRE